MDVYKQIAKKINEADAVLISASNGLSITEGINLFANNEAMHELFGDLQEKYGIQNLLQGMIGRWPSVEQLWGFWSRMINHYCLNYQITDVMNDLKRIVYGKDYFIVTSNGENHFEGAGFDRNKIFEIEGDWIHMVCSNGCHDTLSSNIDVLKQMAEAEKDGIVPTELIPICPHCGAPMVPSMAARIYDVEQKGRYESFLEKYHGKKIVILELGIGAKNQLIKAPLMRWTAQEKQATYVTINLGEVFISNDIQEKSFGLDGYLDTILKTLRGVFEE